MTLLEAMESGLPIITSDASGIPEVIEDRVHGVLFAQGSSDALENALEWAFSHEKEMAGFACAAQERVNDFSVENMIETTLDLLLQQAGQS